MGWPMNHRFPTSSLLAPNRLTMRLRFIDQLSCVLQARSCQSRRIWVERATSTPLFRVAPTFCKMLERPLMPDTWRFIRRSLVEARETSTEPEMRPARVANWSPTSAWVVRSHDNVLLTKLPGRDPTDGWSSNEEMVRIGEPA